uniref:Uncharacterized protein n=1 Tax=Cannabis sativa TaxID=3483 RepID=A0A803NRP6_CANSA
MAKTRAMKQSKPKSPTKKKKKCGPDSTLDARRTKSMDEVLGIEPILFSDEEDENDEVQVAEAEMELSRRRRVLEEMRFEWNSLISWRLNNSVKLNINQ